MCISEILAVPRRSEDLRGCNRRGSLLTLRELKIINRKKISHTLSTRENNPVSDPFVYFVATAETKASQRVKFSVQYLAIRGFENVAVHLFDGSNWARIVTALR